MTATCEKCGREFAIETNVHGRVVNKKATSLMQCSCGNHIFPPTK